MNEFVLYWPSDITSFEKNPTIKCFYASGQIINDKILIINYIAADLNDNSINWIAKVIVDDEQDAMQLTSLFPYTININNNYVNYLNYQLPMRLMINYTEDLFISQIFSVVLYKRLGKNSLEYYTLSNPDLELKQLPGYKQSIENHFGKFYRKNQTIKYIINAVIN